MFLVVLMVVLNGLWGFDWLGWFFSMVSEISCGTRRLPAVSVRAFGLPLGSLLLEEMQAVCALSRPQVLRTPCKASIDVNMSNSCCSFRDRRAVKNTQLELWVSLSYRCLHIANQKC